VSCAPIVRAETEQGLFWRWLHPDGRYPTDSPRALRMLRIVQAMGPDEVVRLDHDPEHDARVLLSC
jgi:hypothetical protein